MLSKAFALIAVALTLCVTAGPVSRLAPWKDLSCTDDPPYRLDSGRALSQTRSSITGSRLPTRSSPLLAVPTPNAIPPVHSPSESFTATPSRTTSVEARVLSTTAATSASTPPARSAFLPQAMLASATVEDAEAPATRSVPAAHVSRMASATPPEQTPSSSPSPEDHCISCSTHC